MPGIGQRNNCNSSGDNNNDNDSNTIYHNPLVGDAKLPLHSFNGLSVSSNGFWAQHRDDVSYNQLQKFWCELTPQARQNLFRIDKQTFFEHARKHMYCSRCNGLLLEGFLQIDMHRKSLQQDGVKGTDYQNHGDLCTANGCQDGAQDPSVHPWGGLTTAKDGMLTLLDCYLFLKSLKGIQKVFDSARAREREREMLYPDACGGGGRGWISQGVAGYGRGHGTREACALHTARLSVETLVDFWSALGEEPRQSLLRMKEEDFIERLMYRFDSKRFCRDCRRNVICEFKELKELKRLRKETRCTRWFCVADTAFQYEVSHDTVQADWHQTFSDAFGTYHHFEWAIGTGEGKSDVVEFENVGLSGRVQANGLDLSGMNACYITLRAWKRDGCCNELCVKAHALRGQQCVHCKLVVGDGFVTITRGESITGFFEHAEEVEEEEDDDSMDKDGNELDGECRRPQKHAKSPELAREFLLDAATVIFKEQVEKAFREGTARQNAHSMFVCLALKLLEERLHVACKEIITLEKQMKLLEEEEKEKREEEERKERRRTKEREKKLRRKERLREKENQEKKCAKPNLDSMVTDVLKEESTPSVDKGANSVSNINSDDERGDEATPSNSLSPDVQDDQLLTEYTYSNMENPSEDILDIPDGEFGNTRDWNTSLPHDHLEYSHRKLKFRKDSQRDLNLKWPDRKISASSGNGVMVSGYESRYHADRFESTKSIKGYNKPLRTNAAKSRYGSKLSEKFQCTNNRIGDRYDFYSGNHHPEYRSRSDPHITRVVRDPKFVNKLESPPDISKPYHRGKKYTHQMECTCEINERPKSKVISSNPPAKKVWEPLDSQKKCIRSSSGSNVTLRSTLKVKVSESDQLPECFSTNSDEVTDISVQTNHEDNDVRDVTTPRAENFTDIDSGFHTMEKPQGSSMSSSSNSDNCSSCFSEVDSNTYSNPQNVESTSTSESEESSQNSEGREITSDHIENTASEGHDSKIQVGVNNEAAPYCANGRASISIGGQPQSALPQMHNTNINYPVFQAPTIGYYHQNPVSWPLGPTNGLMSFPHSNHYLFPNSYGYGLNGNSPFMQYGSLQPLLNHHLHVPIFQPVSQVNGGSTEDPIEVAHAAGPKEENHSILKVPSTDQSETPIFVDEGRNGKTDKMDVGSNGFSLFHFGGPVALSTGFKPDRNADQPCGKKDSTEYNLFAATNGIKFSIF